MDLWSSISNPAKPVSSSPKKSKICARPPKANTANPSRENVAIVISPPARIAGHPNLNGTNVPVRERAHGNHEAEKIAAHLPGSRASSNAPKAANARSADSTVAKQVKDPAVNPVPVDDPIPDLERIDLSAHQCVRTGKSAPSQDHAKIEVVSRKIGRATAKTSLSVSAPAHHVAISTLPSGRKELVPTAAASKDGLRNVPVHRGLSATNARKILPSAGATSLGLIAPAVKTERVEALKTVPHAANVKTNPASIVPAMRTDRVEVARIAPRAANVKIGRGLIAPAPKIGAAGIAKTVLLGNVQISLASIVPAETTAPNLPEVAPLAPIDVPINAHLVRAVLQEASNRVSAVLPAESKAAFAPAEVVSRALVPEGIVETSGAPDYWLSSPDSQSAMRVSPCLENL